MKRVLIVTYYWPPAGGAGVQRWLKMSKYLPEYGWMPVIYTPENAESPADDPSLLKDVRDDITVIRRSIWEPYHLYKRFVGKKPGDRINTGFLQEERPPSLAEKISVWIRGNLFIPDARRFWIRPSVKYLCSYLEKNPVDAIITTGPPHSMHLIGYGVKKRFNIPWIADFRDPWTKIDFYHRLRLTPRADRIHRSLERQVLTTADKVVTIGWSSMEDFKTLGAKDPVVVTNGYDHADFDFADLYDHKSFSITHVGLMNADRNPDILWSALQEVMKEKSGFADNLKIGLIGKIDFSVVNSLEKYDLMPFVERISYLPHNQAVRQMASSAVLLLAINKTPDAAGILTGKLFEYLAVKRPILCTTPVKGDSVRVIAETGSGTCIGYDGAKSAKDEILRLYELFQRGELNLENPKPERYTRRDQAGQIADILVSLENR